MISKIAAVCAVAVVSFCAFTADVKMETIAKIKAAIPETAPAKPEKPRKILVFTLATGFVHGSIPIGAKMFELMGEKTGAWTTTVSNSPDVFEADSLNQYDAVVMESTTGELFGIKERDINKLQDAEKEKQLRLRKNLLEFVSGGKGIVGIHAATDCSYGWHEYGEMMGGYFNGHPWGNINVRIDDPKSPLTAVFKGEQFDFSDEIYTYKDTYTRDNLHILLSVDLEKSKGIKPGPKPDTKAGENRADHDYGVAWIREYGKGRVFYTLLGHRDETYSNPLSVAFFLAGVQYALGDLKADATPSAKLAK